MVAGGLAFTIPGIWMLGPRRRRRLVPRCWSWRFPAWCWASCARPCCAGTSSRTPGSSTPSARRPRRRSSPGDAGGTTGKKLFGAMGLAGLYTALRDGLGAIPSMLFGNVAMPGVAFGVYNSPMLLAVGFLVGTGAVAVWFAGGAASANFGIVVGGSAAGLWDVAGGAGHRLEPGDGRYDGLPAWASIAQGHRCRRPSRASSARAANGRERLGRRRLPDGAGNDGLGRDQPSRGACARGHRRSPWPPWRSLLCFAPGARRPCPAVIVVLLAWVATRHERAERRARPASTPWRSSGSSCFWPWRRSPTCRRCSCSSWRAWSPWRAGWRAT